MSTRIPIVQHIEFNDENPNGIWVRIYRDEKGVVHKVVSTDEYKHISDFPECAIDHRRYQPAWIPSWRKWKGGDRNSVWVKHSNFEPPYEEAHESVTMMMREICILEMLRQNPHPNICPYLGCEVSPDNYVQGLVFQKLPVTLTKVFRDIAWDRAVGEKVRPHPPLEFVVADIRAAIQHLRSLGLVYVDVKGSNIMWNDASRRWCLIDFAHCYAPGTQFTNAVPGTPGWWDPDTKVVSETLVESMLKRLETYVLTGERPRDPSNDAQGEMMDTNFKRNVARYIERRDAQAKARLEAEASDDHKGITIANK